jgi:LPXTG-motif cell wall-anchored protein
MNARTEWMRRVTILAVGAIGLAFTVQLSAQVQTTKEEKPGGAVSREVQVDRAVVISVMGNDLIVRMEDGTIRHIANVPESTRVTVDGRQLGIHDLKPGMHLQRTITTTTTPKVIVTTQTVTGKVWHVTPPSSVILTMDNGENQAFKVPKGQMFLIDGQEKDVFALRKGMRVSATKVVEEPLTQVQHEASLSGHMPPPPPAPAADTPIMVAVAAPPPAPGAAPAELPKTGSDLPLIGLIGLMLTAGSLGVRVFRKVHVQGCN